MAKTQFYHIVGKRKVLCERRRETNEEIMTRSLLKRGVIDLRLYLQIKNGSQWAGYQGSEMRFKVKSIREAREVIANLKASFEEEENGDGSTGKARG